jgi:hypothetical protein
MDKPARMFRLLVLRIVSWRKAFEKKGEDQAVVAEEHVELLRDLAKGYSLSLLFVDNIADWCREQGISEPDSERPMKIVLQESGTGMMLIRNIIPEKIILQRLNALGIRSQLRSVASDSTERLDSDEKKLAYLFLSEYAHSRSELEDELSADSWVFSEMDNPGFFRHYT